MNKEQLAKIKERIIKLKESLSSRQIQLIVYGSCAFLVILIFIFIYQPLAGKLRNANRELLGLEAQLLSQRNKVTVLKNLDLKGKLMQQKDVSSAINDITEMGRTLDIKFISITPQEPQRLKQVDFKELPINFKIESEYKNLGQFLAYLEEFPLTIVEVKTFSIRLNEKTLPKLNVDLLLNLYMEAEDGKE